VTGRNPIRFLSAAPALFLAPLAVLGSLAAPAAAQEWTYYTDLRRIRGLAADGDTIWIANTAGLVRLNRRSTSQVRHFSAFDGLAANSAAAVAVDAARNKWVAHAEVDAGVSILEQDGDVHVLLPQDGLLLKPGKKSNTVFASGDSVWVGTESGVTLFVGEEPRLRLDADDGLPSDNVLAITKAGADVWIGTDLGLARLRDEVLTTFSRANGLPSDSVLSLGYSPGRDQVWVGTLGGPAFIVPGEDTIRAVSRTGFPTSPPAIFALAFDDTTVWVGTNDGPARFGGASWSVGPQSGLPTRRRVNALTIISREVWAGFDAEGLRRLAFGAGSWALVNIGRAPTSDFFGSIDIDQAGDIWLACSTKRDGAISQEWSQLIRFNGSRFDLVGQPATDPAIDVGLTSRLADIIRIDSSGRQWVGFWDISGGLNRVDAQNATVDTFNIDVVCDPIGQAEEICTQIRFDAQGNVWAGWNTYGVSAIDPTTRQCVAWGLEEGLPSAGGTGPTTNGLAIDRQGRVWVGFARATGGAAAMIDPRGTLFDNSDDLVRVYASPPLPSDLVHAVEADSLGRIWFGTEAGLAIHDPGDSSWVIHRATASSRLLNESIRSIAFLPDGTALVGDNAENIYTIASDARTFGPTYNLTTVGFPNRRVSEIKYDPAQEAVWFALWGGGLVRFVPGEATPPPPAPTGVVAWPNPWITADGAAVVTLDNLPLGSSVSLYSLAGELVREIPVPSAATSVEWDTRNLGGTEVASGIYFFIVRKNGIDYDHGKIAIIR
jgi:ligand-binding sensor domain-containing protein